MENQSLHKNEKEIFDVKEISVIFATIGGFEVPSTASMDEIEEVSLRKEELNKELSHIIYRYSGLIDKIIRGFFMATFGTQSSDEDHPIRAVFATMEILQAVENFQGALLFRTESRHQIDLDNQNVSEELRHEFATNDTSLSDDVVVSIQQQGCRWLITDRGTHQTYSVWHSDDESLVYRGAKIHIGINSGSAWVGKLTAGEYWQTTVIGDTVNLSARLKTKAKLNQIVVSPTTYELTKDFFVYERLAAVSLKGIANPVPIFALKAKTPQLKKKIVIFTSQEDRHSQMVQNRVEAIPPHLRDKINAAKRTIKGERKIVTMLYSDLSGFTELSEKFKSEPEKIAKLMDMCHDELGKVVYKYEGIIDQIVGDELMAIFGALITHEDAPDRAVLAGLEMLSEIKRFSEKMGREMGMPPLNVHIGINNQWC